MVIRIINHEKKKPQIAVLELETWKKYVIIGTKTNHDIVSLFTTAGVIKILKKKIFFKRHLASMIFLGQFLFLTKKKKRLICHRKKRIFFKRNEFFKTEK